MTTKTTTLEAIRDRMISRIEALTPSLLAGTKLKKHKAEEPFRAWAEKSPNSALRRFSILTIGDQEPPVTSDLFIEERNGAFEVLIAYPKRWGAYGAANQRDAEDFINADLALIDGRSGIGHAAYGGYVDGQHSAYINSSIIEGEAVLFSRLVITVTYYRSVSA